MFANLRVFIVLVVGCVISVHVQICSNNLHNMVDIINSVCLMFIHNFNKRALKQYCPQTGVTLDWRSGFRQ